MKHLEILLKCRFCFSCWGWGWIPGLGCCRSPDHIEQSEIKLWFQGGLQRVALICEKIIPTPHERESKEISRVRQSWSEPTASGISQGSFEKSNAQAKLQTS